jgi:predicted nucleic acid-binding protein
MITSALKRLTYWDASAAIEALIPAQRSRIAAAEAKSDGINLLSSLAWAEVQSVIARLERQRSITPTLANAARNELQTRRWHWTHVVPVRIVVVELASRWQLRGADLWHLAAAKTLRADRPELTLFTLDRRLGVAARGEGLA